MYCIVLTARTAVLSFFQNPTHDRESNPHLIFWTSETVKRVRIRFENIRYYITVLIYCCVLTLYNTLFKFVTTQRYGLCQKKKQIILTSKTRRFVPNAEILTCFLRQHHSCHQTNKKEMDVEWSTYVREEMFYWGNLRGNNLENVGLDGRMILKRILST